MSSINNIASLIPDVVSSSVFEINRQMNRLPEVLDFSTLQDLIDGEYDNVTLKEYTNLNNYRAAMNVLYGNNDANPFNSVINTLLGRNNSRNAISAKDFIKNLRDRGVSDSDAFKLYSAMRSYSVYSSLGIKTGYVSARI